VGIVAIFQIDLEHTPESVVGIAVNGPPPEDMAQIREECEQYLQGINQDLTLENWSWLYVRMKHIPEVVALIHESGFTTTID
jgi:hypothetical protein